MKLLVVDDEQFVIDAYRLALSPSAAGRQTERLLSMANSLFGDDEAVAEPASDHEPDPAGQSLRNAQIAYFNQGADATEAVASARAAGEPFQVAFIDVRMPPGIDGKETARRMRAADPDINLVIVSAYSDHNVTDICEVAGPSDKIYYISKPFGADEVAQMARALARRWVNDQARVDELREKIAELAASEARAQHMANHDFLTGAPNRMAFQAELTRRMKGDNPAFALALVDLDRFKHVNDVFGHAAGDDLLVQVCRALRERLPAGSFLARLGGDEFGVLIPCAQPDEAEQVCASLVEVCNTGYSLMGNTVHVGASIGLIHDPAGLGHDVIDLMRFADIAMFTAKQDGRGQVRVFDAAMDQSVKFRQSIEAALRQALTRGELSLHYQPIVDRLELRTVGFEALLRWHNAEFGQISPSVFIPIAEESALIHEIGEWVIGTAIRDSLNWPDLYVSINLSSRQFRSVSIIDSLCRHAAQWQVAHSRIQVEITETAIFEHSERANEVVRRLQELGFRVALDDFGTGYSTLVNVKNLPLDCIKIDKSFIDGLGADRQSSVIVSSITQLARGLGLNVVAEGVESDMQCQALRVVGCNQLQGYLFGAAQSLETTLELRADENASDRAPPERSGTAG